MKKQHWKRNWIGGRLNKESRYLKTLGDFNNSSNRELTVLNSLDNDPTEVNFLGLQVDTPQDERWNTLRCLQPQLQFTSIQPRAGWHGQKTKSLFIFFFKPHWISNLSWFSLLENKLQKTKYRPWAKSSKLACSNWTGCGEGVRSAPVMIMSWSFSDLIVPCLQFAETCTF